MSKFKKGDKVTIINGGIYNNKTTKIISTHNVYPDIYEVEPQYDEDPGPYDYGNQALYDEDELKLTKTTQKNKHQVFNI